MLLQTGAQVDQPDNERVTPLHVAIRDGSTTEVAELMLSNGANIEATDRDGWTSLHYAAQDDRMTIAELLLLKNAKLDLGDNDSVTPLHVAAWHDSFEIASMLIEAGAESQFKKHRELHSASGCFREKLNQSNTFARRVHHEFIIKRYFLKISQNFAS